MCVIVIKTAGVEVPSDDILKKCWNDNPHGTGFSITRAGSTVTNVEKGFLTYRQFSKYLKEAKPTKDDLLILHFRWASHGVRSAGQTHPFPVSKSRQALETLKYKADTVIFHNGIIRMKDQKALWSDTMHYIGGVVAYMRTLDMDRIAKETKGSRICIVKDGWPYILGDGWKEKDGIYYSNMTWDKTSTGRDSIFSELTDAEWNNYLRKVIKHAKNVDDPIPRPYEN